MKVRYTVGARDQLRDIASYLGERNPGAAEKVGLREVVALLSGQPSLGAAGRMPGTREFQVPDLPYRIIYRVTQSGEERCLELLRITARASRSRRTGRRRSLVQERFSRTARLQTRPAEVRV